MDERAPVKVFKVEMMVIDFDCLGEEGVIDAIENARYPNRCIAPQVKAVEARSIQWSDSHPLNMANTADEEYKRLFVEEKRD